MSVSQESMICVRLDKWLWAARFYKTRAIAKEMINGGKVHYNGQRAKSSKTVEVGANIKLRQGFDEKEIIVVSLSEHRQKAAIAQLLYQETPQSSAKREAHAEARKLNPAPEQKPDKKQRRQLIRFKES